MLAPRRFRAVVPWQRIGVEDVAPSLREGCDAAGDELAELGFEPFGWMQRAGETRQLRRCPDGRAYALLGAESVEFLSLAENGRQLATGAFRHRPEWRGLAKREWIDARTLALAEQWQRHEAELAARADFAPRDVSLDELIAECEDTARREREHMQERGAWAAQADGALRERPLAALARLAGERRAAHAKRRAQRALLPGAAVPLAPASRRPFGAIALATVLLALVGTLAVVALRDTAKQDPPPTRAAADALDGPALEADLALLRAARAREAGDAAAERHHLERALDLREAAFGAESLEAAAVLEVFPTEPPEARAAALVRQLRLIAIYERAPSADPAALARAYEAAARVRAELGDAAAAKALRARAKSARPAAN